MSTVVAKNKGAVEPFGIEVDHPRNADVLFQSVPGCRLRTAVRPKKLWDPKRKQYLHPVDEGRHLGVLPEIPGMQLHVNPSKLTYLITDPLYEDEELGKQLYIALESDGRLSGSGRERIVRGVAPQKGTLEVHRMKTLCREVLWLLEAKHIKQIKGPQFTMDDVEKLPGDFLLNPGSRVHNMQPQFEKDFDGWVQKLAAQGG